VKVLLVDDHPLFLDGLRNLLAAHGADVVGTARDGLEGAERVHELQPDIVLLDIGMPRMGGLAALRLIKAGFPAVKVVMLTMSATDEHLFEAIASGASGYVLKTQDTRDFWPLLQGVSRGEVALSPGLAGRILQEFRERSTGAVREQRRGASLSAREVQVLTLVAQGLTYKEAGAKLFLAERTIKYHMGEIVARLQVANRAQAIEYARRAGMVG
jgi:DNA-binding NarL/FixJ family response regulator